MMKIEKWNNDPALQKRLLARAKISQDQTISEKVAGALAQIKARGDEAVSEFTALFDRVDLQSFRVSETEMKAAAEALDDDLRAALLQASANITSFHAAQQPQPVRLETMAGVSCELQWRGIETVGLYVPGGTAPLFSTVLMLAIPAMLAGCRRIVLCAPPQKDGKVNAATLAAAWLCGVREVYSIGGAQAIGAMAYGTTQVPKVDKIFGPGNAYVTMAKQQVSQDSDGAAIDMPAGPSEVMVIADAMSNPAWVAADLLAQAEHDVLAQAILVTQDEAFAVRVRDEVQAQLASLPRRTIIESSLTNSRIILVKDKEEAIKVANAYAPEHLILHSEDAETLVPKIQNAGSVFIGSWTPETAGDYASGTNHVLPTYGAARAYSGLSLLSFMRSMTVQSLSRTGLEALAPTLICMAQTEGLAAHAAAVSIRLGKGA
ncbi:MAG: histidinol dehydrogenase [Alphaproteobacteria bacterium]|nr:histidinol dehydrogenase [Alphaproteobacteria bacterium]